MNEIDAARAEIESRYLANDAEGLFWEERDPWIVSYSGGKDSTLLLLLVVETALKHGRVRQVYATFANTGIEKDGIVERIAKNFEGLVELGKANNLDFRARIVEPSLEHRFFNIIVGEGYGTPYPPKYRWCVGRLKQEPIRRWKRNEFKRGRFITLTGERFAESKNRREAMRARLDERGFYKATIVRMTKRGVKKRVRRLARNEKMWAPIRNVSSEELWRYLDTFNVFPWGESKADLLRQYGAETAREIIEGGKERRSGCRFCSFCKEIVNGLTPEGRLCRSVAAITERSGDARCLIRRSKLDGWYNVPTHYKENAKVIKDGLGIGVLTIKGRKRVLDYIKRYEWETGRVLLTPEDYKFITACWKRDEARIENGELVRAQTVLITSD